MKSNKFLLLYAYFVLQMIVSSSFAQGLKDNAHAGLKKVNVNSVPLAIAEVKINGSTSPFPFVPGQQASISLKAENPEQLPKLYWKVWVDFNQNDNLEITEVVLDTVTLRNIHLDSIALPLGMVWTESYKVQIALSNNPIGVSDDNTIIGISDAEFKNNPFQVALDDDDSPYSNNENTRPSDCFSDNINFNKSFDLYLKHGFRNYSRIMVNVDVVGPRQNNIPLHNSNRYTFTRANFNPIHPPLTNLSLGNVNIIFDIPLYSHLSGDSVTIIFTTYGYGNGTGTLHIGTAEFSIRLCDKQNSPDAPIKALPTLPTELITLKEAHKQRDGNMELSIASNPTSGSFTLYWSGSTNEKAHVLLYTTQGRQVPIKTEVSNRELIPVHHLAKGLYYIQWQLGSQTGRERLWVE